MGTNYIAPTWRQPENTNKDKLSNYGLSLNGQDQSINCGNIPALISSSNFTISGWFTQTTLNQTRILFGTRGGNTDTVGIYTYTDGFMYIDVKNGSASYGKFDYSTVISADTWFHLAMVFDGSGSANADKLKLYINNSEVTLTYNSTIPASTSSTALDFKLGIVEGLNDEWLGKISQVAIFDYTLSTNQISYLYNSGTPANPMAISGGEPVAYWPLGDNSNPIATAGYPNISASNADSAFQFPGGNTFPNTITFGTKNSEELKITDKITISIWIKTTDNNYSGNPLEPFLTRNQYSEGWLIGKRWETSTSDGFLRMWLYNADGTNNVLDAAGNWDDIANGKWRHIAYTYDGTSNAGGLKVYVDGQFSNSIATASTGIKDSTGSNWDTLILGMRQYTYETIDGEYSNLSIFNTNLPATGTQSIESLYGNGVPPEISNYNNLVGWWKLDQTANWEADSTGSWQIPDAVSAYPQSFSFNNTTDAINVGITRNGAGISLGTVHTINFWVNFKPPYSTRAAYILSSGSENGWVVYANNGGTLYYKAGSSQYFSGTMTAPTAAGVGKWHNITITRSGANINFYQNGNTTPFATTSTFAGASTPLGDIDFISADRSYGSSIRYSNFTFYDIEFTPSQVSQIYNNGVPLTSAIATSNLKAWYKLDDTAIFYETQQYWGIPNAASTSDIINFSN